MELFNLNLDDYAQLFVAQKRFYCWLAQTSKLTYKILFSALFSVFLVDISHLIVAERFYKFYKLRITWIFPCSLKRAELKHPATVNLTAIVVATKEWRGNSTQCSLTYETEVNC